MGKSFWLVQISSGENDKGIIIFAKVGVGVSITKKAAFFRNTVYKNAVLEIQISLTLYLPGCDRRAHIGILKHQHCITG